MEQSNPKNYMANEIAYFEQIAAYYADSSGTYTEKAQAFSRFVPRQALSYFLARNEIFQQVISVHGSIFDFGCYRGSSLFTWLQLTAIYEPYNHIRKIFGFDSFEGFSAMTKADEGSEGSDLLLKREGGMKLSGGARELSEGIKLYDLNRPLGHVPRASVVEGVLPDAFANFLDEHQESIVALANFGLGLYAPTATILKLLKPRLTNGSVIVFEDLNQPTWPGETKALLEVFSPGEIKLRRFPYCPHISWLRYGD
jgi:hypothetical protein